MDKRVYIDNAGTTPMAPEVVAEMTDKMSNVFGNASTTNYYGRIAKQVLEDSRHVMAKSINAAYDDEIVITVVERKVTIPPSSRRHWPAPVKDAISLRRGLSTRRFYGL